MVRQRYILWLWKQAIDAGILTANPLQRFNSLGFLEHILCVLDTKEDIGEIKDTVPGPQRIYGKTGVCWSGLVGF